MNSLISFWLFLCVDKRTHTVFIATMDANGLNILLSGDNGLFRDTVPHFLHQAAAAAAANHAGTNGPRVTRSSLRNNDISLNDEVVGGVAGFRGMQHHQPQSIIRSSSIYPTSLPGRSVERLPSVSVNLGGSSSGPQQLHSPASLSNLSSSDDVTLEEFQMNRRSRVFRRGGAARQLALGAAARASGHGGDSLLMHAIRETNGHFDFNFGPNDTRSNNAANGNDIALSDVATIDFAEPHHASMNALSFNAFGSVPRSFAANSNLEGVGLSADRALEIMDDSDEDVM